MEYTYLTHNSIYDDTVKDLQVELTKAGYLNSNNINGYYDLNTEKAFKKYQKANDKVSDGVFNSNGFYVNEIEKADNDGKVFVTNKTVRATSDVKRKDKDTKPFFNDDKTQEFRKGSIEIEIEYANSDSQKKKIQDVRIRSMSQVIDTSGEVIADVYNFVAKDIIESI